MPYHIHVTFVGWHEYDKDRTKNVIIGASPSFRTHISANRVKVYNMHIIIIGALYENIAETCSSFSRFRLSFGAVFFDNFNALIARTIRLTISLLACSLGISVTPFLGLVHYFSVVFLQTYILFFFCSLLSVRIHILHICFTKYTKVTCCFLFSQLAAAAAAAVAVAAVLLLASRLFHNFNQLNFKRQPQQISIFHRKSLSMSNIFLSFYSGYRFISDNRALLINRGAKMELQIRAT